MAAKLTTSPATNTYKRGSSVNLTCAAEGYPAPKICWEFRNETVSCQTTEQGDTKSESTIELTSLYPRQHGGMYTCKADNGHTDEVSFLVECKVTLNFKEELCLICVCLFGSRK